MKQAKSILISNTYFIAFRLCSFNIPCGILVEVGWFRIKNLNFEVGWFLVKKIPRGREIFEKVRGRGCGIISEHPGVVKFPFKRSDKKGSLICKLRHYQGGHTTILFSSPIFCKLQFFLYKTSCFLLRDTR